MMGDFELNKPGFYTPKDVEENDWLNEKLENDNFGRYYSVVFEGDASTVLWQTKTKPEIGKKYFGMIQTTKSGKSTKFKRLKEEDYGASKEEPHYEAVRDNTYWDNKDARIQAQFAIKTAANVIGSTDAVEIESFARVLYDMVGRIAAKIDEVEEKVGSIPEERKSGYEKAREVRDSLGNDEGFEDLPPNW